MPRKDARSSSTGDRRRRSAHAAGEGASEFAKQETSNAGAIAGDIAGLVIVKAGAGERIVETGSWGRLGILQMNEVELDAPALDAEADRLLAAAAPHLTQDPNVAAAPGAGATAGSPGVGSWIEVTPGLVAAADVLLIPQWRLRDQEKEQLGGSLAGVLDQLFPGGLGDPRWAPWFRLLAVSTAIAFSRRDPITGEFPAFGPMKVPEQPNNAAAGAGAAGDRQAA